MKFIKYLLSEWGRSRWEAKDWVWERHVPNHVPCHWDYYWILHCNDSHRDYSSQGQNRSWHFRNKAGKSFINLCIKSILWFILIFFFSGGDAEVSIFQSFSSRKGWVSRSWQHKPHWQQQEQHHQWQWAQQYPKRWSKQCTKYRQSKTF